MTFSAPDTANEGGSVRVADLAGHLLIIEPIEYKSEIQTVHGPADAVAVNLIDLDANNSRHDNVLFFNVALKNALRNKLGQKVLARIGQGTAKPGKSAPWILLDATGNAADVAKANAVLSQAPAAQPSPAPVTPAGGTGEITPEIAALLAQLGAKPV
jgi:hypothetical protein